MKFLSLSLIVFGISVMSLYLAYAPSQNVQPITSNAQSLPVELEKPSLIGVTPPDISAFAVYILHENSDTVLYQKNANELLAPASTTKMMTALVASEQYELGKVVSVPRFKVEGQKMGLFYGEQLNIESLLYGTLVDSANDAAEVISRIYPEGREEFVLQMNTKARLLGMSNTLFRNPTGLDEPAHLSTAHDMALLGRAIMQKPHLKQIVGTTSASVSSSNGKSVHYFKATNELLSTTPGVLGIKTGWTVAAHENLVTYVQRDGNSVIISLFGSDSRFLDTKKLIDWVYTHTKWQ